MRVSQSIRKHRLVVWRVVSLVLAAVICGTVTELVSAEESERNPPELKLSLRDAIQAAIDNNVNVRLLKERIAAAQARQRPAALMKDVSDQVTFEVRNALLTLESSMQQVAVSEKGLELALKELTFAKDRFAAGLTTNIEVTNAQTSVERAKGEMEKLL